MVASISASLLLCNIFKGQMWLLIGGSQYDQTDAAFEARFTNLQTNKYRRMPYPISLYWVLKIFINIVHHLWGFYLFLSLTKKTNVNINIAFIVFSVISRNNTSLIRWDKKQEKSTNKKLPSHWMTICSTF